MKLLKSRAFLIPFAIVVMLAVGVASAFGDLKSDIRKTEQLYYDGVKSDSGSYVRPSIYSQMNFKYTTANSILALLEPYAELDEAAAALRAARDRVFDCTGAYNEDTVRDMSAANEEMVRAVEQVKAAVEDVPIPERESKQLERCLKDMDGAQNVIEQSGYNEAVTAFNMGAMQRFPAKQMLKLLGNQNGGAAYFMSVR